MKVLRRFVYKGKDDVQMYECSLDRMKDKISTFSKFGDAGHDAQFAAYMLPTTMIFVQSKDGLSHCEPEYSSPEHCTEGATVMLNAVLKADND